MVFLQDAEKRAFYSRNLFPSSLKLKCASHARPRHRILLRQTGIALYDSDAGLLAHALHSRVAMRRIRRSGSRTGFPATTSGASCRCCARPWPVPGGAWRRSTPSPTPLGAGAGWSPAGRQRLCRGAGLRPRQADPARPSPRKGICSPLLSGRSAGFSLRCLLVSGGHTQLMQVTGVGAYELLGGPLDDAAGEPSTRAPSCSACPTRAGPCCRGWPRGAGAYELPRPMLHSGDLNFSFSGLKRRFSPTGPRTGRNPGKGFKADTAWLQDAIVQGAGKKALKAPETDQSRATGGGRRGGANRRLGGPRRSGAASALAGLLPGTGVLHRQRRRDRPGRALRLQAGAAARARAFAVRPCWTSIFPGPEGLLRRFSRPGGQSPGADGELFQDQTIGPALAGGIEDKPGSWNPARRSICRLYPCPWKPCSRRSIPRHRQHRRRGGPHRLAPILFCRISGYDLGEPLGQKPPYRQVEPPSPSFPGKCGTTAAGRVWQGECATAQERRPLLGAGQHFSLSRRGGIAHHYVSVRTDVTQQRLQMEEITRLALEREVLNLCAGGDRQPDERRFTRLNEAFASLLRLSRRGELLGGSTPPCAAGMAALWVIWGVCSLTRKIPPQHPLRHPGHFRPPWRTGWPSPSAIPRRARRASRLPQRP